MSLNPLRFTRNHGLAFVCAALLTACGGSGSSDTVNSDPSTGTPPSSGPNTGVDTGTAPVTVTDPGGYPQNGDPVMGAMGTTINWPLVPIHTAITPDGRVVSFGRDADDSPTMLYDVWDWREGTGTDAHLTLPNRVGTDLFCSNQILLSSGEMLITGGDVRDPQYANQIGGQLLLGNKDANVFNPDTNTISRRGQMNEARWYGTVTALPWGEIYIQGGEVNVNTAEKATTAEIATEDGSSYRTLTGFAVGDLPPYYPRNFVNRSGHIIGWSHNNAYRIDPRGTGSRTDFDYLQSVGDLFDIELNNGSLAVMYRPGKVLLGGGGTGRAVRADINTGTPVYESVPDLDSPRLWGTATVMPTGDVLIANGGTSDTSIPGAPLGEPAYHVDIYNPESNTFTRGASQVNPRLYHSTSLLLPNATVFLGGGGKPGPVTNLNAEIYYPPYLFNSDGTLATRPVISRAPTVINPLQGFSVESPDADSIARVVLIKTGAVTHSFDMEQRFIELQFSKDGDTLNIDAHGYAADTPPGFYHIFLLNQNDVPSVSHIARMNKYTGELPALGE